MSPVKNLTMHINDGDINVSKINNDDYICLTDMAKAYGAEKVVESWLRNKNTINPDFNSHEFVYFKNNAGTNKSNQSISGWVFRLFINGRNISYGR